MTAWEWVPLVILANVATFAAGYCVATTNYFSEWHKGFKKGCELGRKWLEEERVTHAREREFDRAVGRYQSLDRPAPNITGLERQIRALKGPLS